MLNGLNAVVALSSTGEMVAFRKGSPLVAGVGKDANFISSDTPALANETENLIFLKEGEGVLFKNGEILLIDSKTGKQIKAKTEKVVMEEIEEDKGNFAHYLLKEIYEQPEVILRVASSGKGEIEKISSLIKSAWGTYFTACGTASHAGLCATYMFSEIAKRHVNFAVGSEFPYFDDFLVSKSLLIAASQSGETMDTLEAVRSAKKHKAKVLAMVNVPGSSLSRLSDVAILLKAGPERAVLSTKAYIAKLALFLLLAYTMAGEYKKGKEILQETSKSMYKLIKPPLIKQIKQLAKKLKDKEHLYIIGKGFNYPTALEGALKIKEASYMHAEGFAGGELKHGVIALIEKQTPCIAIVAEDRAKEGVLSNAMELKARGAYIIGVSPKDHSVFDFWIKVPDAKTASPLVSIVPMQLLAYYLTVLKGYNPDKPRNLAKSVTVK
jgi:glucosamine--fructose-6-phosphate aminotransferase (isomerizing)